MSFNFETILQAHDSAIRAMTWSHSEMFMVLSIPCFFFLFPAQVTGDHSGQVMIWQPNMNNIKSFLAHKEAVRDVKFSRTDLKMATCSDDVTIKIWDFATAQEEVTLTG